jgi:quinoprotein glucose dehydrogenase
MMIDWKIGVVSGVTFLTLFCAGALEAQAEEAYQQWRVYGGGPENIHYSALNQIKRENVHQLEVAWTYDTGDAFEGSEMQCNPIVVNDVLYVTTPKLRVLALDAASGKLSWSFDPNEGKKPGQRVNRGLTYWEEGDNKVIFFCFRHFICALDAKTGRLISSFGDAGRVDMRDGLGRDVTGLSISATSPGIIYKDLFIVGSSVGETLPAAPGHIRAYDARTGKLRWTFHTIPHPGEFGYETWPKDAWQYIGGANSWGGMALDEKRGLVFVPTGSAAFDFYGPNRHGDNLFANSLLCLDATTGKRRWHFQVVKHDVWDRDLPAAPALVKVRRGGRITDAVAQITKSGHIFVLERTSGKPIFPIEYRKVPASGVVGEKLAETQAVPTKPPAVARQILTEEMLTRRTPEAHRSVLERFLKLRSNGQFEPPSLEGTIVFPGFDGGPGWGGAAFDPETGLYYVNSSEVPCVLRLVERPKLEGLSSGKDLYERHCASCHGMDLQGNPPEFPSLIKIARKYDSDEIRTIIREGAGRMPGFASLGRESVRAVAQYLLAGEETKLVLERPEASPIDLKYTHDGYNRFLDPDGYPAVKPPWGSLNTINLHKGEMVSQIPLGEHPELVAKGVRDTGSWNYGGPIVTAGGLLFIGATNYDRKFRAFDKTTGKLLWETVLPAAGNATPATYETGGRQYVVIAAGGGKRGAPSGGTYVTFALPKVDSEKRPADVDRRR